MPWKAVSVMEQRLEFVQLASQEEANRSELCRRFGVSRDKGYKWLRRFREGGLGALRDRPRRPHRSPGQTPPEIERAVLAVRDEHPVWGGRKIRARLLLLGRDPDSTPSASTITAILHRHGRIHPDESAKRGPWQRFEHPRPNDLWQMDFKGDFAVANGGRCYPLTVLDDHSRYAIGLRACGNQRSKTVHTALTDLFGRYGLPRAMLMDRGTPWAVSHVAGGGYTRLTVWLMRLEVRVVRGRPYHPQTQGKDERFHRTLKNELLRERWFEDLADAQRHFDPWRQMYNTERPHEALGDQPPASRYRPSQRSLPSVLPEVDYPSGDAVRKVSQVGQVHFQGRVFKISEAFRGERVGIRTTTTDGLYEVYFAGYPVGKIDLRERPRGRAGRYETPVAPLPPSRTSQERTGMRV